MRLIKVASALYVLVVLFLFFYSFTQVDLSLTLSQLSVWQVAQKFFQNIGYFQRPLSVFIYVALLTLLFGFYFLFLFLTHKKIITIKTVWFLVFVTSIILAFSYNAFSYDLFNYIFDAKIVTYYNQNPYTHKALDFLSDPMLSFMHWTHRLYPYGPVWLILTIPLSFIGSNFFLLTFFLFKLLMAASYVGSVFFIEKIMKKSAGENEVFAMAFFAFNPLVLIEGLVSAHNDIVMIFFSLWAIYLLMINSCVRSLFMIILSIGVKFVSVFMVPIFLFLYFFTRKKSQFQWQYIFLSLLISMVFGVILASIRTNFQPWYLLYILPLASLVSKNYYILIPGIIISFFACLQYVPFLYLGNWNAPVPVILFWLTLIPVILSSGFIIGYFLNEKNIGKKVIR